MAIAGEMPIDFRKFRKEFVLELIDLQKQYQDEFVKWAAEKLEAARREFGSKATEETEGFQILSTCKTPRVDRSTRSRLRIDIPNENEEAELSLVQPAKEEEGATKRVTRTASRRALADMNTFQEPPSVAEPKPAPAKRQTRGRKKKPTEEAAAPPPPSKRMTRAASRKAAAVIEVIELDEEEEEVPSSQDDGGVVKPPRGSAASDTSTMEEALSLEPSNHSELHVVDIEEDVDETDGGDAATGEAGVRKQAKRAKVSTSKGAKSRQCTSNRSRKMSKQMRTPPYSIATQPPTSPPLSTHPSSPPPPPPTPPTLASPPPMDSEEGNEPEQPHDISQPLAVEDLPPPDVVSSAESPMEDNGTVCDEKDEYTKSCDMGVQEEIKGLGSEELPSVGERMEVANSLLLVEESAPSPRISSPDLLTPYMKNSPFKLAACKEDGNGDTGEQCRRETFSVSAVGEDGAEQQGGGSEGGASTGMTQTEQVKEDQCNEEDELALKSAKRKAVVRSFFHHPLTRNNLDGGNVAKMIRDYEANSTTPAPQSEVAAEAETLTSSKPPAQQGDSPKAPLNVDKDKSIEQFYSSLLEKAHHRKKTKENPQSSSSQPQPVEAVVLDQQQQTPDSGAAMTRAGLSSFFDSLIRKQQKSVHRGKPEDAKESSQDKSEEQDVPLTLQETTPVQQEMAPVQQEMAPMLQEMAPMLQDASPALQDVSPMLHEAAPRQKKLKSRDSLEEYLTADEREDSIEASPSAVVGEEDYSPDTQDTSSEVCKEAVSPEEAIEVSPPLGAASDGPPSTSLPQSTSSIASASWRPEFWEAWYASNKGGKSTQLKPAPPNQKESRQVTFLQSSSAAAPPYSTKTCVASPKKKKQGAANVTAKLGNLKFLSLLKVAPPQKDSQSAVPSAPPAVKSFLPCPSSPAKPNQSERANELKQRLEEKDKKMKEFELLKQREHKDKFKKQKERALLVSQRRAQLEEEEVKRLQQLAKKEDMFSKKRTNLLNKKQKELDDLRRKQEEQVQAVLQRKKHQEIEFQKKLQAQLEEEQKVAAENEKRRVEYEERERQRRKAEEDRRRKAGEHLGEEAAKKQGYEHDGSDSVSGVKLHTHASKLQHPLGSSFIKPPPYQQTASSGSGGSSKLLRPGFASPYRQAQTTMPATSFISPQTSNNHTQSKVHAAVTAYAMTPDVFGQVESYDIQDLSGSDDTEDEETTTKVIPTWAQPQQLKQAILEQERKSWNIESIFPPPQLPIDLTSIFGRKRRRYHHRTSSVNWDTPPKPKKRYYCV